MSTSPIVRLRTRGSNERSRAPQRHNVSVVILEQAFLIETVARSGRHLGRLAGVLLRKYRVPTCAPTSNDSSSSGSAHSIVPTEYANSNRRRRLWPPPSPRSAPPISSCFATSSGSNRSSFRTARRSPTWRCRQSPSPTSSGRRTRRLRHGRQFVLAEPGRVRVSRNAVAGLPSPNNAHPHCRFDVDGSAELA